MLAKRIIPCLDVHDGNVVKGVKFQNISSIGDPVELAMRYCSEGADELVFYDISASYENRKAILSVIEKTARNINIPLTVGGGVNTVEDFYNLLSAGADKVSINSGAIRNPKTIAAAAKRFGNQCVVLSMDVKKIQDGKWMVFSMGGRESTLMDAIEWAKTGESLGAGEIVINSIDRDGVYSGYDLEITSAISKVVGIPVIASGGAGESNHFVDALTIGGADGALAASLFHRNQLNIGALKRMLASCGIPIRLV
jgi:cyclase